MQRHLAFYIFVSLIACGIFLTLLPYPTFYTGSFNLSHKDIAKISEGNENEDYSFYSQTESKPSLTKLGWFEGIANIMPYGQNLKAYDVRTGTSFSLIRIGGENHADVTPSTQKDETTIGTLFGFNSNSKRPVIIEILPNLFCAASLSGKEIKNQNQSHYCLFFSGSKAHSTSMTNSTHQKIVDEAFKNGKKLLAKISL